jgi:hypothetical protein
MKNINKSRLANLLIAFIAIACQLNLTASENNRSIDTLTVIVSQYDNLSPLNAKVTLEQTDAPFDVFTEFTDSIGYAVFDSLSEGYYDITIEKPGYGTESFPSYLIDENKTLNVSLCQNKYPARKLTVNTLTSKAKWDKARIEALAIEDFEDELFPPEGWQILEYDSVDYPDTWNRTNQVDYIFPPQNNDSTSTWYAGLRELEDGPSAHRIDVLVSPYFDLRISDTLYLTLDKCYHTPFAAWLFIEYSCDSMETWYMLYSEIEPENKWKNLILNLEPLSGIENNKSAVKFEFYVKYFYTNVEACGLDNISITGGISNATSYKVFLDDEFIAETPAEINAFDFECLNYGQEYTAGVKAVYPCGVSEMEEFTFTSNFTYPPREIGHNYTYGTKNLQLKWLAPENCNSGEVAQGLVHFNIYRNKQFVASRTYNGQGLNVTGV